MAPQNRWFSASPNTDYIFKALTDGTVTNMTGGRIPKMNAIQAAGLVGSWLIETGRKDLRNLDVVEEGAGAGRGLSQYTGVRRGPYDQARSQAIKAGQDPNSAQWQLQYFAKEYMNRDLIGWTRVFEQMPQNLKSPGDYARYFTGSAAEGKGYFRPGTPHTDRRMQAAMEVFNHYSNIQPATEAPKSQDPKAAPKEGNFLQDMLNKLGIKAGAQSFNTDKLNRVVGSIAANMPASDVGLAIFASQKGVKNPMQAWKNLDSTTRKAWATAGNTLAIQYQPSTPTMSSIKRANYSLPERTNVTTSQTFGPRAGDLSGTTNNYRIGGNPNFKDMGNSIIGYQNSIYNNNPDFGTRSSAAGSRAFSGNFDTGRINAHSYNTNLDLGRSLGISGSAAGRAAAAGGNAYGSSAMGMSPATTSRITATAFGGSSLT